MRAREEAVPADAIASAEPSVSVVVASAAGGEFLFRCLDSLSDQAVEEGAEVIVVDQRGGEVRRRVEAAYPFVRVVPAEASTSVPALRLAGIEASEDAVVAVIEEHCVASPTWLRAIRSSFRSEDAAIGGPIQDDEYRRLRDWVVYFSEYHGYLPPWPPGAHTALNGANIAYDRKRILRHRGLLGSGYWEVVLHPQLIAEGGAFRAVPGMTVRHTGPFRYGYYLRQRYLLSRAWGGAARHGVSPLRRVAYLLGAPVFPLLLLFRIARNVAPRRALRARFIACLPLLVPVAVVYVVGEWLGYLAGPGGALENVE